jgi:hypothetical protein
MTPNVVEMSAAAPNQLSRAKMLAKPGTDSWNNMFGTRA